MAETFEKYTIQGYTLSEDIDVLFNLWDMTPDTFDALEKVEKAAMRAKSADYDRIARAIKKYPHNPLFKEFLIRYHINKHEYEKVDAINAKIQRAHPEYISAFVHEALGCFEDSEFDKMPEILGHNFDLKDFYPDRSIFHIEEFLKMQYAAVLYFFTIGEFEKAEDRLRLMNKTGPYDEMTILARDFIADQMERDSEDGEDNPFGALTGNYTQPVVPDQPPTKKTMAPALNHPEVRALYNYTYDLPEDIIDEIKELPRKTLIEDLIILLYDSINRYTYLTKDVDDFDEDEIPVYQFVEHAIYMLAELKATETRTIVYTVLSQSENYDTAFLSGFIDRAIIDPLYILLAGDPKRIVETIKQPARTSSQRKLLLHILREIAFQEPDKKPLIQGYYDELLDFFLASKPEDNVQDNVLMDVLVINLIVLGAKASYPKISELRSKKMLFTFQMIKDYALQELIDDAPASTPLLFLPMAEKYAQIEMELLNEADDDENEADEYATSEFDDDNPWMDSPVEIPEFNHPEIENLYYWGFDIPEEIIEDICALPRKTLIEDLEKVLIDSTNRLEHFIKNNFAISSEFVTHAIFLLAEIKAVESTPVIYKILDQSENYFDWFLIDIFDQNLLDPLYTLLSENPANLNDLIMLPQKRVGARIIALDLLKEIALQEPDKKLMVLGYYRQIIDFLLSSTPEDDVQDTMVTDGIIMNLIDLGAIALLPEIKKLRDSEMSALYNMTDMDIMEATMRDRSHTQEKLQLLPMIAHYREVQAEIDELNEEFENYEDDFNFDRDKILSMLPDNITQEEFMSLLEKAAKLKSDSDQSPPDFFDKTSSPGPKMSVVKSPKVGRNDPCPCGSGKKYKKCCI